MNPSQAIIEQVPPNDPDAEKGVIGSLLLCSAKIDEVSPVVQPEDFYAEANTILYRHILAIHDAGRRIDATLLLERLQSTGDLEAVGGSAYLAEVLHSVPYAANAVYYAKIVVRYAKLRSLRAFGEQLYHDAHDAHHDPDALLEAFETHLAAMRLGAETGEPVAAVDAALKATAHIDAIRERGHGGGVPTGIATFDQDQGGLFPGELVILAARPGCGKTSLALQIAAHNAARERLTYFASLEMSAVELSIRLACGHSGVSNRQVRIGKIGDDDSRRLAEALAAQAKSALEIHDRAALTVATIRREIRKRKKCGIALAVVDYLQLIAPEDRRLPREQQVARMVRQLKETAREYEIPILCLCQLNRQADSDDAPRLSQLRESGAIEQDADVVLFLQPHEPKEDEIHNAILMVAKNRNGETGPLRLHWEASRTRFSIPGHAEFAEYGGADGSW